MVMDLDSGRILYEKNANEQKLIASTTKIMTCIIALENATNLDQKITAGEEILKVDGTNIYVQVGEELTIKDLLYGLMLRSGNDAATVLANHIFETEEIFINKMNEKAKELGMNNTTFQNPHGLDDNTKNYSTAQDMAILGKYAFQNENYRKIVSTKKYLAKSNFKSYAWYNRMSLLNNYKYCIGGKNGYTPKAGKSLVSYAEKDEKRLLIVTLDDPEIYENHKMLFEKYFERYQKYTIVDKENFYISPTLTKGATYYIKESFSYLLKEEEKESIKTLIKLYKEPKKDQVGEIEVLKKEEILKVIPIYQELPKNSKEPKKEGLSILEKLKKLWKKK